MPMIDPIDPDQVRDELGQSRWQVLHVRPSVGSTNADLAALARQGAGPGTVVATTDQSAGRARHTRSWTTPPGVSLAVSMLLQSSVPTARWTWLPLLTGIAVAAAVRRTSGLEPELKWPNDVLLDGRKLCGILAEQTVVDGQPMVVMGCGINVAMTEDELPVPTATSLRLAGAEVTMTELLVAVLQEFDAALTAWEQAPDQVHETYTRASATIGRPVRLQTGFDDSRADSFVTGTAIGVDEYGRLVLDINGAEQAFSAGDVVHLRGPSTGQ